MSNEFGLVDVDIYKSSLVFDKDISKGFHDILKKTFKTFEAYEWVPSGDGAKFIFNTTKDAVDACIRLTESLVEFNKSNSKHNNQLLFTRIGIICIDENKRKTLVDVGEGERGRVGDRHISRVAKLQKKCPVGKIAISDRVYNNIGVRQDLFRPGLVKDGEDMHFVLTRRSIMPRENELFDGLTHEQKKSLPAIPFPAWPQICPKNNDTNLAKLPDVFNKDGLLVILGETLSDPQGPLSSAATSDAIGILELMSNLNNKDVVAGIDRWEDTADLAYDRNIILVGSGIVNTYAFVINDMIEPAHFVKTGGRIFDQIVVRSSKNKIKYFGPHTRSPKDCGLVGICCNPFNIDKKLLWIAGITGMGTQAAAKFVLDLSTKASTKDILKDKAENSNISHPILAIVSPSIPGSPVKISEYYKRWRIQDYRILWMADKENNVYEAPLY